MNKFKPKSIRYCGELQKPFTDCSSFPNVDFTKFDFPIEVIESPLETRMENEIFSAVKRAGVMIDKDELLRALNYERDQYAKGYQAGYEAAQPKWISTEERLPEVSDVVLVIASGKPRANVELHNAMLIASYWGDEGWIADGFEGWDKLDVTHWMQLPEPPKEGT